MTKTTVSLRINLKAIEAGAHRRIQRLIHLVGTALSHSDQIDSWAPMISGARITYSFGSPQSSSPEEIQREWIDWILANGFRDLAEIGSEFLEWAQQALSVWAFIGRQDTGETLTGADWEQDIVRRARSFNRRGLPDKLEYLSETYGFRLDPRLESSLRQLTAARNCLVHRGGIVAPRDTTADDNLRLEWNAMTIVARNSAEEREVGPGDVLEPGTQVTMEYRPRAIEYSIGERFTIQPNDFAEVAWSVMRFGLSLAKSLESHGRAQGIRFNQDDLESNIDESGEGS